MRAWRIKDAENHLLGLELFGMRFGLERMRRLMTVLGMPQQQFASIHVVGSNGKTSTARFIAAILGNHGLRTGCYTSPHLCSFRERIQIDGRPVSDDEFALAIQRAVRAAELVDRATETDDRVTQFELLTGAAYWELAQQEVEVAVIEAGLGGRFDATNVLQSSVQVLSTVSLEHTRWLGPTLQDILAEKLAIVPEEGQLVVGDLTETQLGLVEETVAGREVSITETPALRDPPGLLSNQPHFQRQNALLAATASETFLEGGFDAHLAEQAIAQTAIPGRLQTVSDRPLTVFDGAHNIAGAQALTQVLDQVLGAQRPRSVVIGMLDDKDAIGILEVLLPNFEHALFSRSVHPRSLSPATLMTLAQKLGHTEADSIGDPFAALEQAKQLSGQQGSVLVTGSLYLVGELLAAHNQPAMQAAVR